MADGKAKLWIAYHIKKEVGREKALFNRVGHAFKNKDGSFNLKLEYLPLGELLADMTINIREYVPREKTEGESFSE